MRIAAVTVDCTTGVKGVSSSHDDDDPPRITQP